jgi:hypothetical protein
VYLRSVLFSAATVLCWSASALGVTAEPSEVQIGFQSAELLRFGEVKPLGWMLSQMEADLDEGLAGHYPEISDSVNARQFVMHTAGNSDPSGRPGWWYGEHEGYYADGLFRLAWLSGRVSLIQGAVRKR